VDQTDVVPRRSQKYDDAFAAVREVINRHDPEGLIEIGAPADEYDPEVADLVRLVLGVDRPTPEAVLTVWEKWFSGLPSMPPERATSIAQELAELRDRFLNG
jgi:hypothetical protein